MIGVLLFAVGCSGGGGSAPASTPTAPTVIAPSFPSMTGGWSGTRSLTLTERGGLQHRDSNLCTETWIIGSQTEGRFSGTFQTSGGTTTVCSHAGPVSGDVSTTGTISNVVFTDPPPAGLTVCTRTGGSATFGGVVTNAAALTVEGTDLQRCTVTAGAIVVTREWDRTTTVAMNKR